MSAYITIFRAKRTKGIMIMDRLRMLSWALATIALSTIGSACAATFVITKGC